MFGLCLLLGLGAVYVIGRMDRVDETHATRAEAEAAGLFSRGWLPSCIPTSAFKISASNNLDLNTSKGSFFFAPTDSTTFLALLRPLHPASLQEKHLFLHLERGYTAHAYEDESCSWTFYVNTISGHCDYEMKSLERHAAENISNVER